MVKVLTLLQCLTAEKQQFRITQPTNVGRDPKREWLTERIPHPIFNTPEEIEVLLIVGDNMYMSRNHALITPYQESFRITDLNSHNGTFVNGRTISTRDLEINDRISFGTELEMKVESMETPTEETEAFALLIGYYPDGKEIVKSDLASMEKTLNQRRYPPGRIQILEGEAATKSNIRQKVERIARESTNLGNTLIYFSGHGAYDGITVHGEGLFGVGEKSRIQQKEMYAWLRNIRGRKALLLDCCRSGAFLDSKYQNLIPPETLVLCATGREEFAQNMNHGNGKQGKFAAGIVRYLEAHPERISLKELAEKITAEELGIYQAADPAPKGRGSTFILRTKTGEN